MTRSKVVAKKHFKTKMEFTRSLHLKKCSLDITNMFQKLKYDVTNKFEIADRTLKWVQL